MIISKVTAFDLSNADINQRTLKTSLADQRIRNDQTQSLSKRFEISGRRTFGTIQEGENIYLNFNPFSPLVNNKLIYIYIYIFLLLEQPYPTICRQKNQNR